MNQIPRKSRYLGCLLGGAVGDALGAPVEFLSLAEIRLQFGPAGVRDYAPAYGRVGAITDDTQMTLFTAEGLLRAAVRRSNRGICHPTSVIHHAYLRWLKTQGYDPPFNVGMDGWLIGVRGLWSRREPGKTCIGALRSADRSSLVARNDSKGCGGVMRVAPIGLIPHVGEVFSLACEAAGCTHGHPTGKLAAGFLARLINLVVNGKNLEIALDLAEEELVTAPDHDETRRAVGQARMLAGEGAPTPEKLERLGGGWVAEEALAISIYCTLVARSFEDGVLLAVNHSGDSDSTGAITGNILGAMLGVESIPDRWLGALELRDEITRMAEDFFEWAEGRLDLDNEDVWRRYPGH